MIFMIAVMTMMATDIRIILDGIISIYLKRDRGDKENSFNAQTACGRHAKDFTDLLRL